MISPRILYVRVTERCNARCFMCDCWKSSASASIEANSALFLGELDECVTRGMNEVVLTGGEPLTVGGLSQVVRAVAEAGVRCSMITNGMLLSGGLLRELLRAGLAKVTVSIDSPSDAVHDRLRGVPGLLQMVRDNVEDALRVGRASGCPLALRVNTVVSHLSLSTLHMFPSFLDRLGALEWSLIPLKGEQPQHRVPWEPESASREAIASAASLAESKGIRVLLPESMRVGVEALDAPNACCRVLENVAFMDIPGKKLAACNLTIYRTPEVVIPYDWRRTSFLEAWSEPTFVKARRRFRMETGRSCSGCEPANRVLHDILSDCL